MRLEPVLNEEKIKSLKRELPGADEI